MISTEPIERILENVLYSGQLKDEVPLSVLMVGKPEVGKTSIAKKFLVNKELVIMQTDTCYSNMINETIPEMKNKGIRHVIIPDMIKVLMKKQSTSDHLITLLNSLIEEGIYEIGYYNSKKNFNGFNAGIITAVTDGILNDRRRQWERIGFLSRCIPVSFSYAPTTVEDIFTYQQQEAYKEESTIKIKKYREPKSIEGNEELFKQLQPFSQLFGKATQTYGFRYQRHFQVMAKANALKCGRKKICQEDIDYVKLLMRYINLDQVQL